MFNGDYTVVIVLCEIQSGALHIIFIGSRRFIRTFPGGLKGELVPGDAHPYLVPRNYIEKPPLISSGGFVVLNGMGWTCYRTFAISSRISSSRYAGSLLSAAMVSNWTVVWVRDPGVGLSR